jgi:hypothetical protein
MRKAAIAAVCLFSLTFLGGCDFLSFIWQGIVGKYSQITFADIQSEAGNMSASRIFASSMPGNSVLVYKTRSGLYGKLGVLSSSTDLTIDLTTYNSSGTGTVAQSNSLKIPSGQYCDLESGVVAPTSSSADFQWSVQALIPDNSAVFYVHP